MTSPRRLIAASLAGFLLIALSILLVRTGTYGLTLFVVLPIALGALAAWVTKAQTASKAASVGMVANLIASAFFLSFGWEGILCIAMALPLALPLGALGGWLAYTSTHKRVITEGTAMLLLLPLAVGTLGFDATAKPHVFEVKSSIEIAAPPERVWKSVVAFSELPPPTEWYFKTGLAYPIRAHIDGTGPGAVRYCEFSTGPFVEPIEVWDEPRLLRFSVAQNPAPLNEWSPYSHIAPRHLHGYFISKHGQFLLTPLPNGDTLLEGTTWYQHGLWPETYWTVWSQAIIHRIHMRVLTHIKVLSESGQ
ncbi:MAG TPA: SRPBCC family protein [Candidatus Acidoferrales bacterium]